MARKSRKHSHRRRRRHHTRKQRGGNYTSATTYGMYVNGTGGSQFDRTFSQAGDYANRFGSEYVGAQGQWANQPNTPSEANLSLIQSAGRRHRRHRRTRSRGGFYGSVLGQAIVPGTILAMQQSLGHKGMSSKKYRRQ